MEKTVANRIAFAQTRDLLLEGQNVRICVQGPVSYTHLTLPTIA